MDSKGDDGGGFIAAGSSTLGTSFVLPERPSDDQIIAQEQAIRDAIAQEHPLIGDPKNIQVLLKDGHDADVLSIIPIRPDGDCFYRAVAFGLFSNQHFEMNKFKEYCAREFDSVAMDKYAYECFLEELPEKSRKDNDFLSLANDWNMSVYAANASVMVMRLLASSWLKQHRADYEAFFETKGGTFESLLSSTECLSVDADHVVIDALARVIEPFCTLEILYLKSDDDLSDQFVMTSKHSITTSKRREKAALVLAYRPGHYDLIIDSQ